MESLKLWLKAERGRAVRLAKHLGVTAAAVTHWLTNGVPVPMLRRVHDYTRGEVKIEDMIRPD